jgi:hypothetical protein
MDFFGFKSLKLGQMYQARILSQAHKKIYEYDVLEYNTKMEDIPHAASKRKGHAGVRMMDFCRRRTKRVIKMGI